MCSQIRMSLILPGRTARDCKMFVSDLLFGTHPDLFHALKELDMALTWNGAFGTRDEAA